MTTETVTHRAAKPAGTPAESRLWAVGGVIAALFSFTSVFLSMMLSPEYIAGNVITPEQMNAGYAQKLPLLIAFHVVTVASALLLVVFAAGLHRRLRRAAADSLAPLVALAGILLVAVAQMLGTGLDTEFLLGAGDTAYNLPGDIGLYSHWIATIPWLWVGAGLAALAVAVAARARAVPRWLGVTSMLMGGLTVLIAVSPLQYLAAGPGILWLLITAIALATGRVPSAASRV